MSAEAAAHLLARARVRLAAGDLPTARLLVERLLAAPDAPAAEVRDAAALYTRLLLADGQPEHACAWARYVGELSTPPPPETSYPSRPRGRRTRRTAGLLFAAGAGAAAVAGFAGLRPTPPAATPAPPPGAATPPPGAATASPPGPETAPPTRVRAVRRADSTLLSWTYPIGAHGPVLITASPPGAAGRALRALPPGSRQHAVHGLGDPGGYCFTVAVVYGVAQVAAAAPLCLPR